MLLNRHVRARLYQGALTAMFTVNPERIHGIVSDAVGVIQLAGMVNRGLNKVLPVHDSMLTQEVFGVVFPRPLGLAAGFDKNGSAPDAWAPLGFGYAELGTVTASPQPGNPEPRLFRLPADRAILNRMGFNNDGAAVVAGNLCRRRSDDVIGINIGKTKSVPLEEAAADYRRSARLLGNLADYVVINVSSPNTPGLRDLQAVKSLRPILAAVTESTTSPVLVKIAPDLSDEDIIAVADLAVEMGLSGIVATNTTIARSGLSTPAEDIKAMGPGGVSGPPVAARSLEVLRLLRSHFGDRLALVSVGGIETPQQAWERIAAGASLLQGYTGMIYGGPEWIRDIHLGIARQLRLHGCVSLADAVGSELPWIEDADSMCEK